MQQGGLSVNGAGVAVSVHFMQIFMQPIQTKKPPLYAVLVCLVAALVVVVSRCT